MAWRVRRASLLSWSPTMWCWDAASRRTSTCLSVVSEERSRAIDVTVWSTTAQSSMQGAAKARGYTASRAEAAKHAKHDAKCQAEGMAFTAFALEQSGGMGTEAATLFRHLVELCSGPQDGEPAVS